MNIVRIAGIVLIAVSVFLLSTFDSDQYDFMAGLLLGGGLGMAIAGKIGWRKKPSS